MEPLPTDRPEPEWLEQAGGIADIAKWILAGVGGLLLILLLIGAVRRGKSRSESKKAMDHLQGATYRDYSTQPRHRRRSEIDNGGAGGDAKAAPDQAGETVQDSELMAETLKRLYSDQPAEAPAKPEESAADAPTADAPTADAPTAETPAEEAARAAETVQETAQAAEEAARGRRRRGKKTE